MMPQPSYKLLFVAGENSGDQHASRVIEELKRMEPGIECFGYGGERMEKAGMRLDENLAQKLPIIGITQALRNIGTLRKLLDEAGQIMDREKPDAVVLVDYPGFNLRVAAEAKARNIPVIYFISPQIWAWHHERLKTIAACVRQMLVILPFEEKIYHKAGVPVTYVGHPLLDQIGSGLKPRAQILEDLHISPEKTVVGLLPGSRESEVIRHLPVMLEAARLIAANRPATEFILPRASTISHKLLGKYLSRFPDVRVCVAEKDHQSVRAAMDFAICKSGTSTLELALLGVPMIVIYKVSVPTYIFGKIVVRIKWIGLVNIVANETVAPEFIQHHATSEKISRSVLKYLGKPDTVARMKEKLARIRTIMGPPGASQRAAGEILRVLREGK